MDADDGPTDVPLSQRDPTGSPPAPPPRVGRKVVLVGAANVAGAALGYGSLLVIGRAFDPAAYGSFLFAGGIGGLFSVGTTLGLSAAHQRLVARGEDHHKVLGTAARIRFALLVAGAALVAFLAWGVPRLGGPSLTDATTPAVLAAVLSLHIVAMARQLFAETWNGFQRVGRAEGIRLLDAVFLFVTIANGGLLAAHLAGRWVPIPEVGAWWAGLLGLDAPLTPAQAALLLAACNVVAKLASYLVAAIWALRDGLAIGPYDPAIARALWAFGLPLAMTSAIGLIVQYTDIVLLGYFWTATEVGLYGTAQKLSVLCTLAATAAGGVLFSRFARLSAEPDAALEESTFQDAERWLLVASVPVAVAFVALAGPVIHIAVGDPYLAGTNALRLLALAALVSTMQVPIGSRFMGHGLARTMLIAGTVNAVSNVAFNVILVPPALFGFGPAGAAGATLCASIVASGVLVVAARRRFGTALVPRAFLPVALAGAIVGVAWWQVAERWPAAVDRSWELVVVGLVGTLAYALLLVVLRVVGRRDVHMLRHAIHPVQLLRELRGHD